MSSSLTFQLRHQASGKHEPTLSMPSPPDSSCGGDEARDLEKGTIRASSEERRDSLQTHFSAMTLHHFSQSLPDNYTIDHSSPIPIQSLRRPSRADSPLLSPASTAAAAGTGGRTVRHRRPSESAAASLGRKSRLLSESPGKHAFHQCTECGKVYKHPNCLSKHRWEHSEQWELTSKLLLTKHQQVQMLEAAAILVGMDSSRRSSVLSEQRLGTSVPVLEEDEDEGQRGGADNDDNDDDDSDEITIDQDEEKESMANGMDDEDDDILIDMEEDDDKPYVSSSSFTLNPRSQRV